MQELLDLRYINRKWCLLATANFRSRLLLNEPLDQLQYHKVVLEFPTTHNNYLRNGSKRNVKR